MKHDLEYSEDGAGCRACGEKWSYPNLKQSDGKCSAVPDTLEHSRDLERKDPVSLFDVAVRMTEAEGAISDLRSLPYNLKQIDTMVREVIADIPERMVDLEAQMQRMVATVLPPDLSGISAALEALSKRLEDLAAAGDRYGDHIVKAHCRIDQLEGRFRQREDDIEGWLQRAGTHDAHVTNARHRVDALTDRLDKHERGDQDRVTYAVAEANKAVDAANLALELVRAVRQAGDVVGVNVGRLTDRVAAMEDGAGGNPFQIVRNSPPTPPPSFCGPSAEVESLNKLVNEQRRTINKQGEEIERLKRGERAADAEVVRLSCQLDFYRRTGYWDIPEELVARIDACRIAGQTASDQADFDMEAASIVADLQRALKDRPDGWIPVGERLPDELSIVIAGDGSQHVAYYDADTDPSIWHVVGADFVLENVTHWRPLPKPPKECQCADVEGQ